MKDRIIRTLSSIAAADPKSDPYVDLLCKDLALPKDILIHRSAALLSSILHHYSDFSVTTIDSFVHRIIRVFAQDLRLPVNFEVSTDTKKFMEAAVDLMLASAGPDSPLTRFLVGFTTQHQEEERNWDIRRELNEFISKLLRSANKEDLDRIRKIDPENISKAREYLLKNISKFRNKVKKFGEDGLRLISVAGIDLSYFHQGARGFPAWLKYLAECRDDKLPPNSYVTEMVIKNKWYGAKTNVTGKAAIDQIRSELSDIYNNVNELLLCDESSYVLNKMILRNIFSLGVSRAVLDELERLKREDHVVWIEDLNEMISTIVAEQPAPFVYERSGERYKHYLVDEFQDTSGIQWKNLLPLIHHALSEGNANLVVGDSKQAIYRWRGGDVEQFQSLPNVANPSGSEVIAERERALISNISVQVLDKNYRSLSVITGFNNDFFKSTSEGFPETIKDIYRDVSQKNIPGTEGGFVSIEFIDEKRIAKGDERRTLELIEDTRTKGFSYGDIAILTRDNAAGSEMALALQATGVPVVSGDSLLVSSSSRVRFLIAIMELVHTPSSLIPRALCLEYLFPGNVAPFHLVRKNKEFFSILAEKGFDPRGRSIRKLPLVELCEKIIRSFHVATGSDPYLPAFSDLVFSFASRKSSSLSAFLEWWEERKDKESIHLPEGMDAVRIMTIHKSKGLEFPVVILPWCNWDVNRLGDMTITDPGIPGLDTAILEFKKDLGKTKFAGLLEEEQSKALLDNLNILYVAMTRAAEKLFVLTSLPGNKKNLSPWFISFLGNRNIYKEETYQYTFGVNDNKKSVSPAILRGDSLEGYTSEEWRNRIFLRESTGVTGMRVEELSKRQRGILVHETLACMQRKEDLSSALLKMSNKKLLHDNDKEWMEKEINRILSSAEIAKLFDADGTVNEREILLPDGEMKRMDKLIFRKDDLEVIDFKTGEEKEEHKKQVLEYMRALEQAGYKNVKGKLVYTDRLVVMELKKL